MKSRARRQKRFGGLLVAVTALVTLAAAAQPAAAAHHRQASAAYQHVCSAPQPGHAQCYAMIRTDIAPVSEKTLRASPDATVPGYSPAELQDAYGVSDKAGSAGVNETVAVVDPYNDPNAESDMTYYRNTFGGEACTKASGCFTQVGQTGSPTDLPPNASPSSDWAAEESLDLDMVSAVCPRCHILLVEADSNSTDDLGKAVNEAVALGAKFVSNSYGSSAPATDPAYYHHPGVAVVAASGDNGYHVNYPAGDSYVTAVGGTSLHRSTSTSRGWTESAWSGSSSGCTPGNSKPTWQQDTSGCPQRTVADVSAVADPATGVAVYDTFNGKGGWIVEGGTSASAPIVTALYALAGPPDPMVVPAQDAYLNPAALNDITTGSTASCTPSYLCAAGPGYDGPTGVGTPDGTGGFTGPIGTRVAFHKAGGELSTVAGSGYAQDAGWQMDTDTSPAITTVTGGGYEVAYQDPENYLTVAGAAQDADTALGMMSGTDPALAPTPDGGVVAAFQANTGVLWQYTSTGKAPADLDTAMAPQSSPAIAALLKGRTEIAVQAADGHLVVRDSSTGDAVDTGAAMAPDTSPAITATPGGGYVVAFQGDNNDLWSYSSADQTPTDLDLGMAPGTSPAIAALADGSTEIAFNANTGDLFVRSSTTGVSKDLALGMQQDTSPAIAASADSTGFRVALQANTGDLWTASSASDWTNLGIPLAPATSPVMAPAATAA